MKLKYKNRYLIKESDLADKVLYFIAEDMNGDCIFQYARGYFHLNLPTYETAFIPKRYLGSIVDYDKQLHEEEVERKRSALLEKKEAVELELASLEAQPNSEA